MAIGFDIEGVGNIVPDKQLTKSTSPKVKLASFGDGYEQRLRDGINSLSESYSLSFETRTKEEIDDIIQFFDLKGGVVPFLFTIPDSTSNSGGEKTVKVVCPDYSQTYSYDEYYSCSATFRRVYE